MSRRGPTQVASPPVDSLRLDKLQLFRDYTHPNIVPRGPMTTRPASHLSKPAGASVPGVVVGRPLTALTVFNSEQRCAAESAHIDGRGTGLAGECCDASEADGRFGSWLSLGRPPPHLRCLTVSGRRDAHSSRRPPTASTVFNGEQGPAEGPHMIETGPARRPGTDAAASAAAASDGLPPVVVGNGHVASGSGPPKRPPASRTFR